MKKIILPIAAIAALSLAACTPHGEVTNGTSADLTLNDTAGLNDSYVAPTGDPGNGYADLNTIGGNATFGNDTLGTNTAAAAPLDTGASGNLR